MKALSRLRFDSSATPPGAHISTPRAPLSADYSSAPSPIGGGAERRSSRRGGLRDPEQTPVRPPHLRGPAVKTLTPDTDTPDDLRAQVAELADINDQLLRVVTEQRDLFELTLATFAADGYRPAAKVLLTAHEARASVEKALRDARDVRADA